MLGAGVSLHWATRNRSVNQTSNESGNDKDKDKDNGKSSRRCHVPIYLFAFAYTQFLLAICFVRKKKIVYTHSVFDSLCRSIQIIDKHRSDGHAVIRTRIIGKRKNGSRDMQNTPWNAFVCSSGLSRFEFGHAVSLCGHHSFELIVMVFFLDHEERFQSSRRLFESFFFSILLINRVEIKITITKQKPT